MEAEEGEYKKNSYVSPVGECNLAKMTIVHELPQDEVDDYIEKYKKRCLIKENNSYV